MKKGGLLLALLIILVVCASLYALTLSMNRQDAAEEESAPVLTVVKSIDIENITGFTLTNTKGTHIFERQQNGWVYNNDSHFPMNTDFVNTTLEALSSISAIEVLDREGEDLSAYGLVEPQMTLSITESVTDGKQITRFLIGNYNSFNGYYYMMVEGNEDIFIIDNKLVDLCGKEEKDLIQLDTLPENFAADKITAITVSYMETERTFTDESEGFTELVQAAGALSLAQYEKYYFDKKEFITPIEIVISYSDTVSSNAEGSSSVTSAVDYEYKITASSHAEDGKVLFTVEDSEILYRMDKEKFISLETLLANWDTSSK
ncbi:MAG: DUF4340 domain-containing protein [Clostridiales bacterium]|nr:DUF4340 domain-containing protein [Clostridiales bacterium]